MPKTLSIQIPDDIVTELMTKRTGAEWKQFLVDVMKNELQGIRAKVSEDAKPSVVQPEDSDFTPNLA